MTGDELRAAFLRYFEERGHRIVRSSPTFIASDPTLLFVNAGMVQFKDVFVGREKRPYSRATSAQKCIRAGGKHNDLEEVGRTARHHTFFEMLGNFSFGDYFKEGAIEYAWDFVTRELGLPVERLWFTVHESDDVGEELWIKAGASPDRVLRFGDEDNFWAMGETGPCGPCSEIHYFRGDDLSRNTAELVNGPGDDTLEIWNLVFMEFERDADGTMTPLPNPSIDTGLGLERVAAIVQGAYSNYDTDLIRPIVDFAAELSGTEYDPDAESGYSMRVIADHARATAVLIADGVFPGNEGRNYVLRKIMRRAIWQGRRLGLPSPSFHRVTDFVVERLAPVYPELGDARDTIAQTVEAEESLFMSTVERGIARFEEMAAAARDGVLAGPDAFALYDTYGLQRDLIEYIARDRRLTVDWDGFERELEEQRARARASWKGGADRDADPVWAEIAEEGLPEFAGYSDDVVEGARVVALVRDGQRAERLAAGESGEVVLDRTPFYAEAGGQIGDTGVIESDAARALVTDTSAPVPRLNVHHVEVEDGELAVGDSVRAAIDASRREAIRRSHTATHLLHKALRDTLGPHVKQAGSLVAPDRLRFDFTHFAPVSPEELRAIEDEVNAEVLANADVETELLDLDEAIGSGAMALFGEKYADRVRVVDVDDGWSRELCGGTHVGATGEIGVVSLASTASVASGVRRVEALTGERALEDLRSQRDAVARLAGRWNARAEEVPQRVEELEAELERARKEADALRMKLAAGGDSAEETVREAGGVKVLVREVEQLDGRARRELAENLLQRIAPGAVVIGQAGDGKVSLVVRVSEELTDRVKADEVVRRLAAIVGGGGGGQARLAEAGGRDPSRLREALEAAYAVIEETAG